MRWIYLDNNATTRPDDRVAAVVDEAMRQLWANPSSVHRFGQQVRRRIELARQSTAELVAARPRDLLLTSGGTESNNLALRGLLEGAPKPVLITTRIEHSSVRQPAEALRQRGVTVAWIDAGRDGTIKLDHLDALLDEHAVGDAAVLISVQWANNETGVIQPIHEVAQRVAAIRRDRKLRRMFLHSDATQAVGKIPVDFGATPVDLATFSAHKFHGPKGVGALFARRGVRLTAQQRGGPQERELRGGTENAAGSIGMGVAAELAGAYVRDAENIARLAALRDRFEQRVGGELPNVSVNGAGSPRLWNTSNLAFAGLSAEAILVALSERGVCASAGAACSSGSLDPSPVLLAMGIDEPAAHGSVRFSLSRQTTEEELDAAAAHVAAVVRKLARTMPVG